jgi:hypothetical protein
MKPFTKKSWTAYKKWVYDYNNRSNARCPEMTFNLDIKKLNFEDYMEFCFDSTFK